MTKVELAEAVRNKTGMAKNDSLDMLEEVLSIIKNTLASGENVKIHGFGNFEVKQKNDRVGRNPQSGEAITINGRKIVTYKVSSVLKKEIN